MPWGWEDNEDILTPEENRAVNKIRTKKRKEEKEKLRKETCIKPRCNKKRFSKFLCTEHKSLSELGYTRG